MTRASTQPGWGCEGRAAVTSSCCQRPPTQGMLSPARRRWLRAAPGHCCTPTRTRGTAAPARGPACSSSSRVWHAVTPDPQEETTPVAGLRSVTPRAANRAAARRRAARARRRRGSRRAGRFEAPRDVPGRGSTGSTSPRYRSRLRASRRTVPAVDGVRQAGDAARPARAAARRRSRGRPAGSVGSSSPRSEAAVEQGGRTADRPEHPDQACRDHAPGVVVGDDDVVVPDAQPAHRSRELGGLGQRVPARGRGARAVRGGEVGVEVDEDGARQVAGARRRHGRNARRGTSGRRRARRRGRFASQAVDDGGTGGGHARERTSRAGRSSAVRGRPRDRAALVEQAGGSPTTGILPRARHSQAPRGRSSKTLGASQMHLRQSATARRRPAAADPDSGGVRRSAAGRRPGPRWGRPSSRSKSTRASRGTQSAGFRDAVLARDRADGEPGPAGPEGALHGQAVGEGAEDARRGGDRRRDGLDPRCTHQASRRSTGSSSQPGAPGWTPAGDEAGARAAPPRRAATTAARRPAAEPPAGVGEPGERTRRRRSGRRAAVRTASVSEAMRSLMPRSRRRQPVLCRLRASRSLAPRGSRSGSVATVVAGVSPTAAAGERRPRGAATPGRGPTSWPCCAGVVVAVAAAVRIAFAAGQSYWIDEMFSVNQASGQLRPLLDVGQHRGPHAALRHPAVGWERLGGSPPPGRAP